MRDDGQSKPASPPAADEQEIPPPLRADSRNQCVWQGGRHIKLSQKACQVLAHLLQHPGQLVHKSELLESIWPDTFVSDGVLKAYVAEIRKAIEDDPAAPRYIETVHGRGYRFLGPATAAPPGPSSQDPYFLEREDALRQLEAWLETCREGQHRVVFVTGGAGAGKTTLVQAFAARVRTLGSATVAVGQSLEQSCGHEPYFALFEALSDFARSKGSAAVRDLRHHAPAWLAQMPSLLTKSADGQPGLETFGVAQGRMVREFAEFVCAVTADVPLVLILEDLHWADSSTVDLIGHMARRIDGSRLLLIATLRDGEPVPAWTLCHELRLRNHCERLAVEELSCDAVARHLELRFPTRTLSPGFAAQLHAKTGGNPLFLNSLVGYLEDEANPLIEVERGAPAGLLDVIERQIASLTDERQLLLESASVVGMEFTPALIAPLLGTDIADTESRCADISRGGRFLLANGDGANRHYRFRHELVQQAVYRRIVPARRVWLHRNVAELLAPAGDASVLARHYQGAREWRLAIDCLRQAALAAMRLDAGPEALQNLNKAMELAEHLRDPERLTEKVDLLQRRALLFQRTDDLAAAAADFVAMRAAAGALESKALAAEAMLGLGRTLFFTDHQRCLEVGEEAVNLSRHVPESGLQDYALGQLAGNRICILGWDQASFEACRRALESARRPNRRQYLLQTLTTYCLLQTYRSDYAAACCSADEAMAVALEEGDAYHFGFCQFFKAWCLVHVGRWGEALELLRAGLAIAGRNENLLGAAMFRSLLARMHSEGGDYQSAWTMAQEALEISARGIPRYASWIALIQAESGLGEPERAQLRYEQMKSEIDGGRLTIDGMHSLVLQHALCELRLNSGDFETARKEARALIGFAARSGERTYERLGRHALAEVAARSSDWRTAEAEIPALPNEPVETPLSDWRLLRTASRAAMRCGRGGEATLFDARSSRLLLRIAESMNGHEPLRAAMRQLAGAAGEP